MKRAATFLFLRFALFGLSACQAGGYPPYTIGFATPSGNAIWVAAAHFDNRTWGTPVGSIACCWEESGKGSIIFDRPLPKNIYVNWLEKATNTRYEATLVLPKDIDARARNLPGYVHVPTNQRRNPRIYLIVGLAPGGETVAWLSNSNSAKYLDGHVLDVLTRSKGTPTTEIAPYYPRASDASQGARMMDANRKPPRSTASRPCYMTGSGTKDGNPIIRATHRQHEQYAFGCRPKRA